MSAAAYTFLDELRARGVELIAEGGSLRYRARKGVVTEDLRRELAERKAEVLTALLDPMVKEPDLEPCQEDADRDSGNSPKKISLGGHVVHRVIWATERAIVFEDKSGALWRYVESWGGAWPVEVVRRISSSTFSPSGSASEGGLEGRRVREKEPTGLSDKYSLITEIVSRGGVLEGAVSTAPVKAAS